METQQTAATVITIETTVNMPVARVWEYWNKPEHITQWSFASPDWHTPRADNDLRTGGRFSSRMEAKDGSMGFDFGGVYNEVKEHEYIAYTLDDNRKVAVKFAADGNKTKITEQFDAENIHPAEFQRAGWQAILDNFKQYAESQQV